MRPGSQSSVVSIPNCSSDLTLPGCDCIADSSLAHCICEAYPYLQKCSNGCEGGGLDLIIGTNKVPLYSGRCIQEEFWTSKPN
ncbi:MAG: hypothetical protein KJO47_04705 [Gammaproteobacteria bacterium]|nr:hypothetical protein [Gammaproteobacteria bacterium]